MCLDAVDPVVTTERFREFSIPEWVWPAIGESWRRSDPHLYGRFDLRYGGSGPAKLLEYNADTPTSLLEAAVVQWYWLQDTHPDHDQWNSVHEKLVQRWAEIADRLPASEVHFTWSAADPTGEDHVTAAYLQETAAEAGLNTVGLAIEEIGWDGRYDEFVDARASHVVAAHLQALPVGVGAHRRLRQARALLPPETLWLEPLWKAVLSNKALLAVLWEMYPGHPNLLPAYLDQPGMLTEYVRKPRLGREARTSRSCHRGRRRRPAACTARRATSTSSSRRCRSSGHRRRRGLRSHRIPPGGSS